MVLVFVACEIGERGSEKITEIEDEINKFDWYLFPMPIQQMLPTILISIQKPAIIECFGSISCTREQFKMVKIE